MPNIASLLKSEITRLARKEVRAEIESLKKALASQRSDIAVLKKTVRSLEGELKRATKGLKPVAAEAASDEAPARFRPAGMKAHRQKLGLSAKDYGLLIGASMISVYKWEDGKVRPRDSALTKIAEVRSLGKREAIRRLAELNGSQDN
jgi:DNA-binding transcriptional regulator YiaG